MGVLTAVRQDSIIKLIKFNSIFKHKTETTGIFFFYYVCLCMFLFLIGLH